MDEPDAYCRDIETYLCKKNDGHLIRIVGPAFEQVTAWSREGIPIKIVFAGIDRYFERYYRKGPRRRPVRVEFCEADIRDVFDEWRRAVGVAHLQPAGDAPAASSASAAPRKSSLAAHVERVLARLTALRSSAQLGGALGDTLEHAARDLDTLQSEAKRARGDAREQLIDRLQVIESELTTRALGAIDAATREALEADARHAVAPFRDRMPPEAYQRAVTAALARSVREHYGLPTISFE